MSQYRYKNEWIASVGLANGEVVGDLESNDPSVLDAIARLLR